MAIRRGDMTVYRGYHDGHRLVDTSVAKEIDAKKIDLLAAYVRVGMTSPSRFRDKVDPGKIVYVDRRIQLGLDRFDCIGSSEHVTTRSWLII